jgi:cysteine synthase
MLSQTTSISIKSILETIGDTPLVQLQKMSSGNVFAKAEFLNPGGSIKDRVAKHIRLLKKCRLLWEISEKSNIEPKNKAFPSGA